MAVAQSDHTRTHTYTAVVMAMAGGSSRQRQGTAPAPARQLGGGRRGGSSAGRTREEVLQGAATTSEARAAAMREQAWTRARLGSAQGGQDATGARARGAMNATKGQVELRTRRGRQPTTSDRWGRQGEQGRSSPRGHTGARWWLRSCCGEQIGDVLAVAGGRRWLDPDL